MKKFGFLYGFIAAFLVINTGYTACNSPVTLSFGKIQEPDDNEFLYETEDQFNLTKSGYTNSGKKNSGDGQGYECDHFISGGCSKDDVITMQPGHVFKGEVIRRKVTYQCDVDSGDSWEVVNDGICHTEGFGEISVGECVGNTSGGCRILTYTDCSGYTKTDNSAIEFKGICREGPTFICEATKCQDKMRVDDEGRCIVDDRQQPNPELTKECTQGSGKIISQADCKNNETFECVEKDGANCKCGKCNSNNNGYIGKCHPSVCQSEICKACCAKPASETIWDRTAQACQCVNGGKFIKENNNQWICKVESNQSVDVYKCDEKLMAKLADWKSKCTKHANALKEIADLETYCKGQPDRDVFLRLYDSTQQIVNTTCINDSNVNITIDVSEQTGRVNSAYSQLTAIHNKFRDNVSVWKDAEGNFNTARLASDTVAGVVLGTTGALVTSHVVKKNQVENGFEDIKCTIGGQNVAGWGDQFRVGIQ